MNIASILTMIRPDQPDSNIEAVMNFAGDRHLAVMVVASSPPVPVSAYDMLAGETWSQEVERARSLARERADEVEALLAAKGQPGHVTAHVAGPEGMSSLVAGAARYVDLVVLAGGGGDRPGLQHALVTGALFESGAPAILAADGQEIKAEPGIVQIAWNAEPEVARAVKLALPILKTAREVQVLLVDPVPSARGHGPEPGANFATYMGYHDIPVKVLPLPSEGMRVEEVLARQARTEGADLLVMGAYGHSRLRERIFGGTTTAMLHHPPCPLFMAH